LGRNIGLSQKYREPGTLTIFLIIRKKRYAKLVPGILPVLFASRVAIFPGVGIKLKTCLEVAKNSTAPSIIFLCFRILPTGTTYAFARSQLRASEAKEAIMDTIKKILAPTDLSELSEVGVRYALNLARTVGAAVTVYHAIETAELMRYSRSGLRGDLVEKYDTALQRFLEIHCSDFLPGVEIYTKAELGTPDVNIVDEAKKDGVDLIVISTHGRTGLSHIVVGSVTERVVRHAPCPVLSIRPETIRKPAQRAAAAA
jgi:universal stress protein A